MFSVMLGFLLYLHVDNSKIMENVGVSFVIEQHCWRLLPQQVMLPFIIKSITFVRFSFNFLFIIA